ncbi:MAG: DUF4294 domain-containing protein [Bacteroidales bacterium]|nr:DUF4294 domain-containing protein [Bacteroidales bacterium]
MKAFGIIFFVSLFSFTAISYSQTDTTVNNRNHKTKAKIINGDTVAEYNLAEVNVYSPKIFKDINEEVLYYRLVRNIRKTYPMAKIAEARILQYNEELKKAKNEREKRQIIRKAEKALKDEFTAQIKQLSYSQGEMLLKLIYRQTGHTSFELIKEYRGAVSAAFWQTVAKLFSNDLKMKYDPEGADKNIEELVKLYEQGLLK